MFIKELLDILPPFQRGISHRTRLCGLVRRFLIGNRILSRCLWCSGRFLCRVNCAGKGCCSQYECRYQQEPESVHGHNHLFKFVHDALSFLLVDYTEIDHLNPLLSFLQITLLSNRPFHLIFIELALI
jgi:hypothetical protein